MGHKISPELKFITIYNHKNLKFKVSKDFSILIRYSPLNGRKCKYKRVTDKNNISKLEKFRQWSLQSVDMSNEYYVLRNVDLDGHYTGVVKIVKKTKATVIHWATIRIKANPEDWIYYEKG